MDGWVRLCGALASVSLMLARLTCGNVRTSLYLLHTTLDVGYGFASSITKLPNTRFNLAMTRTIPPALYDEVFTLVTAIAQPAAEPLGAVDEIKASDAYAKLLALFKRCESSGEFDPFLTEALADFTSDKSESIRLYGLALDQCAAFPGEATLSKRIGLARALIEASRTNEARDQIEVGRREAFLAHDAAALEELNELALKCAV
jgi:hypothetical protein